MRPARETMTHGPRLLGLRAGGVLAPAALTAIRSVLSGREGTGATSTQVERTAAEGSSHSKGSGRLWRALSTR